jgi:predicted nucleotidyltransferase
MLTANKLESAIASTALYYDLLNRPLTNIEIFKFISHLEEKITFSRLIQTLNSPALPHIRQFRGFYFFNEKDCSAIFGQSQKRMKISQLKWKKAKKMAAVLQITPFLRLIGITGSLSLQNSVEESDIDLLIALQPGRLWIGRTFVTLLLNILGWRRHGHKRKNRACLNCYLAGQNLEIRPEIKPRSLHSAQEYSRLIPIWQADQNVFSEFQEKNAWIGEYLENYPWPRTKTPSEKNFIAGLVRKPLEALLSGFFGNWLEKRLANWQSARIKKKMRRETNPDPADQIYFSNEYLMFHPHSKSAAILDKHREFLDQYSSVK